MKTKNNKQLAGQSCCLVQITCRTVSVLELSCAQLHARNLHKTE